MEPTQSQPPLGGDDTSIVFRVRPPRERYVIPTRVLDVREEFSRYYEATGEGALQKFEKVKGQSLGWYVQFEGSFEALYLGTTRPKLSPGDRVKITIEKTERTPPCQ